MSIFYRPHRGGLKEAMDEAKIFNNINEMVEYIIEDFNNYGIGEITKDNVSLCTYDTMPDSRIGWEMTYMVKINNYPHGFFTDQYKDDWKENYQKFITSH